MLRLCFPMIGLLTHICIFFFNTLCAQQTSLFSLSQQFPSNPKLSEQSNLYYAENKTKPPLDTSVYATWPTITDYAISNNGKTVYYLVHRNNHKDTLFVRHIDSSWSLSIAAPSNPFVFSNDSRYLLGKVPNDTLLLINLITGHIEKISGVQSFRLVKSSFKEWLLIESSTIPRLITLHFFDSQANLQLQHVEKYFVSSSGDLLLYSIKNPYQDTTLNSINLFNITTSRTAEVVKGKSIESTIFSDDGSKLAFISNRLLSVQNQLPSRQISQNEEAFSAAKKSLVNEIVVYDVKQKKLSIALDRNTVGLPIHSQVNTLSFFSRDGKKIYLRLTAPPSPDQVRKKTGVNVWSYLDVKPRHAQPKLPLQIQALAVLDIDNKKATQIQQFDENLRIFPSTPLSLSTKDSIDVYEQHWNVRSKSDPVLVNNSDGTRMQLGKNIVHWIRLSPNGEFVIGYDSVKKDIYCFFIKTKKETNLTRTIETAIDLKHGPLRNIPEERQSRGIRFQGWLKERNAIIASDGYDLWVVSLEDTFSPINITQRVGKINNIEFSLAYQYIDDIISEEKPLYLSAYDGKTGDMGFYRVDLITNKQPMLLSKGSYNFSTNFSHSVKQARDTSLFLLFRESATESPNVYATNDFKQFRKLSFLAPEKDYNWLTAELCRFKTLDGRTEKGILYKPSDFNSKEKYPAIITYYEQKSKDLNKFHKPLNNAGHLDMSWFVSHGYIVFVPDIHYEIGAPGNSALNSISGAGKYLRSFPWIDGGKIGLQGFSFGAYETNFVITRDTTFAAAISSSGPANFVSGYTSGNLLEAHFIEQSQNRIGATLWDKPELFIDNSPIFKVDKINTPILTVANQLDANVPYYTQGLGWFMALRRAGKRAWMLEYDGEGHGVFGTNMIDYVLRSTQFFDHYLKGKPAPRWMTRGIPVYMKGVDDGMDYDNEIKTPPVGGLLIKDPSQ